MWEIYAYGNVDTLLMVFNGIAAIMSSGDYLGLVKTISLFAFIAIFIAGLGHGRFEGFKWFFSLILFYSVFFVPRVDVAIIDRLLISPPGIVRNVPLGVAFFGHFTSKIGDYLTRGFESVFTMPGTLKYGQTGMMFGHRIIEKSRLLEPENQRTSTNLHSFIRNCTMYDIIEGRFSADTLRRAPAGATDAWSVMVNTNLGRLTSYTNPANSRTTENCGTAYSLIDADLIAEQSSLFERLGLALNPMQPRAIAATMIQTQMTDTYSRMLNVAASAEDILRQNIMINQIMKNGALTAVELNDSASNMLEWSTAQAITQTKIGYGTMANVARETLPLIRNAIEVIIYAIFPLTFLLMIMPVQTALGALRSYVATLAWLQLWAPLYAIMNMMVTIKASNTLPAITDQLGLTLFSAIDITNSTINDLDVAGYMVISIPLIAMMIIKGGEMAMTSVASGLMQPAQSSSMTAAGSTSTGNLSMRNVSYDNANANKHDESYLSRSGYGVQEGSMGSLRTDRNGHVTAVNLSPSDIGGTAGRSTRTAESLTQGATTEYSKGIQLANEAARQHTKGESASLEYGDRAQNEDKVMNGMRMTVTDAVHKATGKTISAKEADSIAYSISGTIGGSASDNMSTKVPGSGAKGGSVPKTPTGIAARVLAEALGIKVDFSAKGSNSKEEAISLQKAAQEITNYQTANGIDSTKAFAQTVAKSQAFREATSDQSTVGQSAKAHFAEGDRLSTLATKVHEAGSSANADLTRSIATKLGFTVPEDLKQLQDSNKVEQLLVNALSEPTPSPFLAQQRQVATTAGAPTPPINSTDAKSRAIEGYNESKPTVQGMVELHAGTGGSIDRSAKNEYDKQSETPAATELRETGKTLAAERDKQAQNTLTSVGNNVGQGQETQQQKLRTEVDKAVEPIERDGLGVTAVGNKLSKLTQNAADAVSNIFESKSDKK